VAVRSDDIDVAVELLTPDAVSGARDMGDLELRHLRLEKGEAGSLVLLTIIKVVLLPPGVLVPASWREW
jgi:hypothetical protein